MTQDNIYKQAVFSGLRFNLGNGEVTVCDLPYFTLENLDAAYTKLHQELESSSKATLLRPKTKITEALELKMAIIKDIVETKQSEDEIAKQRQEKSILASKIREELALRKERALGEKPDDELLALLNELDG